MLTVTRISNHLYLAIYELDGITVGSSGFNPLSAFADAMQDAVRIIQIKQELAAEEAARHTAAPVGVSQEPQQ